MIRRILWMIADVLYGIFMGVMILIIIEGIRVNIENYQEQRSKFGRKYTSGVFL